MLRKIFYILTGGRPMKRGKFVFRDSITDRGLWTFKDKFDRYWLAENEWGKRWEDDGG